MGLAEVVDVDVEDVEKASGMVLLDVHDYAYDHGASLHPDVAYYVSDDLDASFAVPVYAVVTAISADEQGIIEVLLKENTQEIHHHVAPCHEQLTPLGLMYMYEEEVAATLAVYECMQQYMG